MLPTIWYTTGSAKKTVDNGTIIGSGAYCRLGDMQLKIAPCGIGPTNTIMRAELFAIYVVLLHPNNISKKCTIVQTIRLPCKPFISKFTTQLATKSNTHEVLLKAIAASLLQRAHQG